MDKNFVRIDPSVAELLKTEEGQAQFAEVMALVTLQQMGMLGPAPWYFTQSEDAEHRRLYEIIIKRYGWTREDFAEKSILENFPDDEEMQKIHVLNALLLRRQELLGRS